MNNANQSILTVLIDNTPFCSYSNPDFPTEKRFVLALPSSDSTLQFVHKDSATRSFDLSSLYLEGGRYMALSIHVGRNFSVQSDCIVAADKNAPFEDIFKHHGAKAVRFQPFFLPESKRDNEEFFGRGMFARGLHLPGVVTPSNVSSICICEHCSGNFRLQSFHAGFSEVTYLYCSGGPHVLTISNRIAAAHRLLDDASSKIWEKSLPLCKDCNGFFAYFNPLLCPICLKPYIDFRGDRERREKEYYGNFLYGQQVQTWTPVG